MERDLHKGAVFYIRMQFLVQRPSPRAHCCSRQCPQLKLSISPVAPEDFEANVFLFDSSTLK